MEQHHPVARQPDPAVARREMDQPTQIGVTGQGQVVFGGHIQIIDKNKDLKRTLLKASTGVVDDFMKLPSRHLIISSKFSR
jgi:hypothetical protein